METSKRRPRLLLNFPIPYPDEMLESIIARYQLRRGFSTASRVLNGLFRAKVAANARGFPLHRLPTLIARVDPRLRLTWRDVLASNTLVPYDLAFAPDERKRKAMQLLSGGQPMTPIIGHHRPTPKPPRSFHYCCLCARDDRHTHGEAFWHRSHHLPGVTVCHIHGVQLTETDIAIFSPEAWWQTAEQVIPSDCPMESLALNPLDLQFALESDWILRNHKSIAQRAVITNLRWAFWEAGIGRYGRTIQQPEIDQAILKALPTEFLSHLGLWETGKPMKWATGILGGHKKQWHINPGRYIVMALVVSRPFSEVVNYTPTPFGEGPWPCLNPLADHYRQPMIQDVQINFTSKDTGYMPVGNFACNCGYTYYRYGPDSSPRDLFRHDGVRERGSVYERAILQAYKRQGSIASIARQHRMAWKTVETIVHGAEDEVGVPDAKVAPLEEALRRSKDAILAFMRTSPNASRTDLARKMNRHYARVMKYDRQWLKQLVPNKPRPAQIAGMSRRFYADEMDPVIAAEIHRQAVTLRELGHPRPIRKHTLVKRLSHLVAPGTVIGRLSELPLTRQAIDRNVESEEDYRRRIRA